MVILALVLRALPLAGEHANSNQNQIWCVNIREYMVFGPIVGSDCNALP